VCVRRNLDMNLHLTDELKNTPKSENINTSFFCPVGVLFYLCVPKYSIWVPIYRNFKLQQYIYVQKTVKSKRRIFLQNVTVKHLLRILWFLSKFNVNNSFNKSAIHRHLPRIHNIQYHFISFPFYTHSHTRPNIDTFCKAKYWPQYITL
jgi:hypothetical protein